MKVIVTGATGYIGRAVLNQCLADPHITSVLSLSRRDPGITHPKLTAILHDDFTQWPASLTSQLQDADACIYCLGTNIPVKPKELNRKINFDYAVSCASTFARIHTNKFRFVYLSGALPEKDPERKLWFLADNRRMRGELERELIRLDGEHREGGGFEVFVARPGFVQPEGASVRTLIIGAVANAIMLDELAGAMERLAREGNGNVLVENSRLKELARE